MVFTLRIKRVAVGIGMQTFRERTEFAEDSMEVRWL